MTGSGKRHRPAGVYHQLTAADGDPINPPHAARAVCAFAASNRRGPEPRRSA